MTTPKRTKLGERGDAVKAWQSFLAEQGLLSGKIDGIHGKGTEAASVAWEQRTSAAPSKPAPDARIRLTADQKRAIDSVLSIFETGRIPTAASYGTCAVLPDGAGISYGKHQCTDASGSLDLVCLRYVALGGRKSDELRSYMPYLERNESAKVSPKGPYPDWMTQLIALLRELGSDPVMQRAQDEIFDEQYFQPALKQAEKYGLQSALGVLVMYDTCIHSGPGRVAKHVDQIGFPAPIEGGIEEAVWLRRYLDVRRAWLLASSNPIVRQCIYRPDELTKLLIADNMGLALPIKVRGQTIVY